MANIFDKVHQEFIAILNKHHVEYLLIGGVAVNLHGYSRGTGDLDIWIGSSSKNKENLVKAIEEFGYDTSEYKKMNVEEITMFSLGSRNEPGHIELTNRIAGIKFEEAYPQAIVNNIEGLIIKYLHFDDLIKNKIASGRPRDLDDVENLKSIKKIQEKVNSNPKSKENNKGRGMSN